MPRPRSTCTCPARGPDDDLPVVADRSGRIAAEVEAPAAPSGLVCFSMTMVPRFVLVKTQVTVSPAARSIALGRSRPSRSPTRDPSRRAVLGGRVGARVEIARVVGLAVPEGEAVAVQLVMNSNAAGRAVRVRLLLDDDHRVLLVGEHAGHRLARVESDRTGRFRPSIRHTRSSPEARLGDRVGARVEIARVVRLPVGEREAVTVAARRRTSTPADAVGVRLLLDDDAASFSFVNTQVTVSPAGELIEPRLSAASLHALNSRSQPVRPVLEDRVGARVEIARVVRLPVVSEKPFAS